MSLGIRGVLSLACVGHLLRTACSQYSYDYSTTNYYDDYQLYQAGYQYDDDMDDGFQYNPYSGSYDDVYGDYYFDDEHEQLSDCRIEEGGKPKFNGTAPCDLKLEGADKLLKGLQGGLDGTYQVSSCQNGLPLYKRKDSKPQEERVLWYSAEFRDWDLANGTTPKEDDILMFGGNGGRETRPEYVTDAWAIAAEFLTEDKGVEEYSRSDVKLSCADGSKIERPVIGNFGRQPLISHTEMDAQYKAVYANARSNTSSAEFNLGLVTVLVMVGLGIVFGLPYLVAQNRRRRRAGAAGTQPQGGFFSWLDIGQKRAHTN